MKGPDPDRERSEKVLTMKEFLAYYNDGLPEEYPHATTPMLKAFTVACPHLFKRDGEWSLDQHRKRVMDWLPAHVRKDSVAH